MRARQDSVDSDDGTVLVLTLGFTVLVLLLVLVVSAATELHLDRIRLSRVADEAALDAADSLDLTAYYAGNLPVPEGQRSVAMSPQRLQAAAEERAATEGARAGLPPVHVVDARSSDGYTATVTVATTVHPLFDVDALLPWIDGITLTATSSARGS